MRRRSHVMCAVVWSLVFGSACKSQSSSGGDSGPKSLLIVKGDPATQQQAEQALARDFNAQRVKTLTRSRADVWQFAASQSDEVRRRLGDTRYFELLRTPENPLLRNDSVQPNQLSAAQRQAVDTMTGSLDPQNFRIVEARPNGLSADVLTEGFTTSTRLTLQLLGNERIELTPKTLERRGDADLTWTGQIVDGGGDALLVVTPEGVHGSVRTREGTFLLRPLPEGRQLIMKVDPATMPREEPPDGRRSGGAGEEAAGVTGGRGRGGGAGVRAAGGDAPPSDCAVPQGQTVDVLVLYTDAAARRPELSATASSPMGIAQLAVTETNQGFEKSGIQTRVRLAGLQQVSFRETHDFSADVATLRRTKAVQTLRESVQADAVLMLVAEEDWCGWADAIDARPATAFAIIAVRCATGYYSFGHELGHLFGARHESLQDHENTPFAFGHGYVQGSWRTVMAYPDHCNKCERILRWSNPKVSYPETGQSSPTGDAATSNNAEVIRARTPRVAGFRCSSQGTP